MRAKRLYGFRHQADIAPSFERTTRRSFLCLAAAGSLGCCFSSRAQTNGASIDVQIRADESAKSTIFTPVSLQRLNVTVDSSSDAKVLQQATPKSRAVPLFYLIAGAIAVIVILEMIQELLRRTEYGGVIIDLRKVPPLVSNDLKVPAGFVFVVTPSGAVTKYTSDELSLSALQTVLKQK